MDKEKSLALQKMFVDFFIGEPQETNKKIIYVLQGDGVWQIRKNEICTSYVHQAETTVPGLPCTMEEEWDLNVPLIPSSLLETAVSFFREVYKRHQSEAHVQFFYDIEDEKYILHCPKQTVSAGSVSYENDRNFESSGKILVLEMHSHGSMAAFFSGTDDGDEKDDRFFGVVGKVSQYYPELQLRLSMGGYKFDVDIDEIFDIQKEANTEFPKDWLNKIKKRVIKVVKPSAQMPLFGRKPFQELDDEMAKFMSGDYLYPTDAFIPDEGEFFVEEGDKKWFIQDGERLFYIDKDGNHHVCEEDEDDELDWRHKRF